MNERMSLFGDKPEAFGLDIVDDLHSIAAGRIAVLQNSGHILGRSMAPPFRDGRGERTVMDWTHILAYVTGTVLSRPWRSDRVLCRLSFLTLRGRALRALQRVMDYA